MSKSSVHSQVYKSPRSGLQKNITRVLTARSFKAHKGRNLVAVVAIVLTTLMFTTLFVLTQSMSQNLVEMAFRQSGYDAHISFKTITDEQIEPLPPTPMPR